MKSQPTSNKLFVVHTKQRTRRAQEFRMKYNLRHSKGSFLPRQCCHAKCHTSYLDSIVAIVKELATTEVAEDGITRVLHHVVCHNRRKRIALCIENIAYSHLNLDHVKCTCCVADVNLTCKVMYNQQYF